MSDSATCTDPIPTSAVHVTCDPRKALARLTLLVWDDGIPEVFMDRTEAHALAVKLMTWAHDVPKREG